MYRIYIKRILDIILSLIALPIVCLAIVIFGSMIYIEDHGTIFYKARRRGLNGRVFNMYKLRSMKMDAPDLRNKDNSTFNSSDDPRVTNVGRFLRKTSIDELPQIINVLKGDMSLIGPRAPIPIDGMVWDDLNEMQQKRLTVRPGLTGYTAAVYRNSIPQEEKQQWDCYYVDNVSFWLDMKIVFWTIKAVVLHKNIYTNSSVKTGR